MSTYARQRLVHRHGNNGCSGMVGRKLPIPMEVSNYKISQITTHVCKNTLTFQLLELQKLTIL